MANVLRMALCSLLILGSIGCARRSGEKPALKILIWSDYLPTTVVEKFTARTGIPVRVETFDSNEELLKMLEEGGAADVVAPSDYMVKILAARRLIQPLDPKLIPNLAGLDAAFVDRSFDPGNRYSVPYLWGTTGLGYNKQKIAGPVTSWKILFDPQYGGRVLMLDDAREAFAAALRLMGKSINETNAVVLREAARMLQQQRKLVKAYDSDTFADQLLEGDVDLAQGYNGQIARFAVKQPERLVYVIPDEGGSLWLDNLCVSAGAARRDAALAFVNFVLDPRIHAEIANAVGYACPNAAARPFIQPDLLNNPAVYPPSNVLARCEWFDDLGETGKLIDQLWTEIRKAP